NEWCPSQWPIGIRLRLDHFVDSLNANRCSPPILYFSCHADTWSMGDMYDQLMQPPVLGKPLHLMSAHHELWAQPLGDGHAIAHHAADFRHQSSGIPEYCWVSNRVQEAAMVYNEEVGQATLLLVRTVVGGLLQDEGRMLDDVPSWIPKIDGEP
ncbi:hypothetical protein, partial [Roseiconus lacunae]